MADKIDLGKVDWNNLDFNTAVKSSKDSKTGVTPYINPAIKNVVTNLQTFDSIRQQIASIKISINQININRGRPGVTTEQKQMYALDIAIKQRKLEELSKQLKEGQAKLLGVEAKKKKDGSSTASKVTKEEQKPPPPDNKLRYNKGSVNEAYFTSHKEFLLEANSTHDVVLADGSVEKYHNITSAVDGNHPTTIAAASELWSNGKSSKGMIMTWGKLETGIKQGSSATDLNLIAVTQALPPHAFRFQYNPGSVSMAYAGTPLVDPNFEASGQDKFNLVGTGVTQSTIQFQLLINRMYDMKYYWRESEAGTPTVDSDGNLTTPVPGTLKTLPTNVYSEDVSKEEQQAIYNLGTMYDIEFLLRTIMGYTTKSYLRDYSFLETGGTADMGFLGARPVELHLGKNLRYLVFITSINVEHVIFDSRMVPIFSNISITCSRLPDYQQTKSNSADSAVTSTTNSQMSSSDLLRKLR